MYQYKDPYIIDFSRVKHYSEMHSVMQEALDFPDYYGRNWDAFWDCLTDMLGRRVHIEILGIEVIEQRFPGQAEILIDIFKEFKHYDNDEYFDDIHIEIHRGNTRESIF